MNHVIAGALAAVLAAVPATAAETILLTGTFDAATGLPRTTVDLTSFDLIPGGYNYRLSVDRAVDIYANVQTRQHSTTYCGGVLCDEDETIVDNVAGEPSPMSRFGKFRLALGRREGTATDYTIFDPDSVYSAIFDITLKQPGQGIASYRFDIYRVPEPATWAMMIGGFGAIGGAARRRRRQPALA